MANAGSIAAMKAEIDANIVPNNNAQLITGAKANTTMKDMIDTLDALKVDKSVFSVVSGKVEELIAVLGSQAVTPETTLSNGFYRSSNLTIGGDSFYFHTNPIHLQKGSAILYSIQKGVDSMSMITEVDQSGTGIRMLAQGTSGVNQHSFVAQSDIYISLSGYSEDFDSATIRIIDSKTISDIHEMIEDIQEEVAPLSAKVNPLVTLSGINLLNPADVVDGYINYDGTDVDLANYQRSQSYIPVIGGTTYKILYKISGSPNFRRVAYYDANKVFIDIADSVTSFTTPSNARFVRVAFLTSFNKNDVGLFPNSATSFSAYFTTLGLTPEDYAALPNSAIVVKQYLESVVDMIDMLRNQIFSGQNATLEKSGLNYTFSKGQDKILITTNKFPSNSLSGNPVVNFMGMTINGVVNTSTDDVAPMHVYGTTIGANHGQPIYKATCPNHGKSYVDVGTEWLNSNGIKFYIVNVIDANTLLMMSENTGTASNPVWTALTAGTLTKSGGTLVVQSVVGDQLYPAIKNVHQKVLVNGSEITTDGTYTCGVVDFIEDYDVMNPESVLNNLIASRGTTTAPVYNGDVMVHVQNDYRIMANEQNISVLVIETLSPKQSVQFQDFMFAQHAFANATTKWYLPNSKASTMNFVTPASWDGATSIAVNPSYFADSSKPVNRVVEINGNATMAMGFVPDMGVGASLKDLVYSSFDFRAGTFKTYAHGVDQTIGLSIDEDDIYQGLLYKCFYHSLPSGNRIAFYHFPLDGAEYVFVDYKSSCYDNVVLSDEFNGKKVSVVESRNVILKGDVYNGGFPVKATYVSGETCYIIVKIS